MKKCVICILIQNVHILVTPAIENGMSLVLLTRRVITDLYFMLGSVLYILRNT